MHLTCFNRRTDDGGDMQVKHGVVVVEVSGGVVSASLISPGVRLIVVDHDNMDAYEVREDFGERPAHYPPDTVLDPRD